MPLFSGYPLQSGPEDRDYPRDAVYPEVGERMPRCAVLRELFVVLVEAKSK